MHTLELNNLQLPTMPQAAAAALRLLNDPDTCVTALQRVIETDPALAGASLRLANSALFGCAVPITTLSHAITMIGFSRLRALILTTVASQLRAAVSSEAAAEVARVWEHLVHTGLAAKVLADKVSLPASEEAYIAGLMHDCGRMVLLAQRTREYLRLVDTAGGEMPRSEDERACFGLDHEYVGGALLHSWGLDWPFGKIAGNHHGGTPAGIPQFQSLHALVALADRLPRAAHRDDPHEPATLLGLGGQDIDELAVEVRHRVAEDMGALVSM